MDPTSPQCVATTLWERPSVRLGIRTLVARLINRMDKKTMVSNHGLTAPQCGRAHITLIATMMRTCLAGLLISGCGGAAVRPCGPESPGLVLKGAHWDPGLTRIEISEATEQCRTQLNPIELESKLSEVDLPAIDVAGYVGIKGGRVKLDTGYAINYEKLSELSHMAVVNAVQQCADINRRYSCFVYDDFADAPGVRLGKLMHTQVMEIARVRREIDQALKAAEQSSPQDKEATSKQAQDRIQKLLDSTSTELPAAPPAGGVGSSNQPQKSTPNGPSSTPTVSLLPLEQRISQLERQVISTQQDLDAARQELTARVNTTGTVAQRASDASVQALGMLRECSVKVESAKQAVRDERRRFLESLGLPPEANEVPITRPLRASLGSGGFDECDAQLPPAVKTTLDQIASGITKFLTSEPLGESRDPRSLYVEIWGYSDQQPLVRGNNPKCNSFTGNLDLAKTRAKAIRDYLKANVPGSVRLEHLGSDRSFVKDCYSLPVEQQVDCHKENRRFEASIDGAQLVFEPPSCR